MRRDQGRVALARLAATDRRIAELHSELAQETSHRAEILQAIAEEREPMDLTTGKRIPRESTAKIPALSEVDQARAKKILSQIGVRRKVRG